MELKYYHSVYTGPTSVRCGYITIEVPKEKVEGLLKKVSCIITEFHKEAVSAVKNKHPKMKIKDVRLEKIEIVVR